MIGLLLALCAGEAHATRVSVGLSPGVQLHTGPRALAVGVGPAASLQADLSARWSARVQLGAYTYGPAFFQANLGALYHPRPASFWGPALGVELASTWGGVVQLSYDTDTWRGANRPLLAPRVLLQPLSFHAAPWRVSALNLAVGTGLESFGQSLSLGVELLSVQVQLGGAH